MAQYPTVPNLNNAIIDSPPIELLYKVSAKCREAKKKTRTNNQSEMASNASYIGTVNRPLHYQSKAQPTPCKSVSVFFDRTMSTRLNSTMSSNQTNALNHWRAACVVSGLITIFLAVLLIGMLSQASNSCTPDSLAQTALREEVKLFRDKLSEVMKIAEECGAKSQKLKSLLESVKDQISMANFTIEN